MGERGERAVAAAFERVDPQVDRRATGQRPALLDRVLAAALGEGGGEPFGIVAAHGIGRAGEVAGAQPLALGLGQRRRRVALAAEQRRDFRFVEVAQLLERADGDGARARLAHQPGGRTLAAQRVVDEAGDRGAVARAGEAARQAPILERVDRRPAARLDVGEHFDGGGDAGGWGHASV